MKRLVVLSMLLAALVGCGGGGSPTSGSVTPPTSAGPMRLEGQVHSPGVDSVPGGLTVYGFTGTITKAYWTDATPSLEESELVYSRSSLRTGHVFEACEVDGSNARTIVSLAIAPRQARVSPDGSWLYYVEGTSLKRVPMGGGVPSLVLEDVNSFAFTPSGAKIVVHRPTADVIAVANANGTSVEVRLDSTATTTAEIAGCITEDVAIFVNAAYTTNPDVGRLVLKGAQSYGFFFGEPNTSLRDILVDWRRDIVLLVYESSDAKTRVREFGFVLNGQTTRLVRDDLPQTPFVVSTSVAPDESKLLGVRTTNPPTLVTLDRSYNILSTVEGPTFLSYVAAWAPAPTFRTFVGAGNYASGASALLFTDKNGRTPAVVLADCATRSTMTLERISDDNDGTLIYRLECDNLTKLHYTKSNSFAQVSVVGSITGLKGAIVSFNTDTGRVSNVVTYAKRPTVSRAGQHWVIDGSEIVDHLDEGGIRRPIGSKITLEWSAVR